jgi:uncharacterized protein YbaR (Trm112 family)
MARPVGELEAVWETVVYTLGMAHRVLSQMLLEILVCPVCHHSLNAGPDGASHAWLHCNGCGLYYPVEDGIPVMLADRAAPHPPLAGRSMQ